MNIQKKIAIIVIGSILMTVIPAALIAFHYIQSSTISHELDELVVSTNNQTTIATSRLKQAQPKLQSFAHVVHSSLIHPSDHDPLIDFYDEMHLDDDGIWRNKRLKFNGLYESGVYIPADVSDEQKRLHMRLKHLMDLYGAAAQENFENIWYLSPYRTEIIFDKSFPDFVFKQAADNDYTNTPWVTLTTPENNPQREFLFTPPLFDPVPRKWMVSALLPLYSGDTWLGSIGIDLQLDAVLTQVLRAQQKFRNSQLFLKDASGRFMLAGDWQHILETTPEKFNSTLEQNVEFNQLLNSTVTSQVSVLSEDIVIDGKTYVAVGQLLEPMGWQYYKLVPIDEILKPSRNIMGLFITIILVVSLLTGLFITLFVNKNITQRIKQLAEALRVYQTGSKQKQLNLEVKGNDEIASAAKEFDLMANRLEQQMLLLKKYSENIRESEQRWKLTLEGVGDGVWDWDLSTNRAIFSINWKKMLGYANDEFKDTFSEWESSLYPDDAERVKKDLFDYLEGKAPHYAVEFRMRCKDGSWKWILSRGIVIKRDADFKPIRMIGTHTDISAQKEIEEQIRQNTNQLRIILDNSPIAVSIVDASHNVLYANKAYIDLLESDSNVIQYVDPGDYYADISQYDAIVEQLHHVQTVRNELVELLSSNGPNKWVLASYTNLDYYNRKTILGWYYDISDRLKAEESMRLHASVFDNAWEGIILSDADNKIITVNQAFTQITGYSPEEVIGQNPNILSSSLQDHEFYQQMWAELTEHGVWYGELWNRKKNGDIYAQRASISAVKDKSNSVTHYVAVFNDITEIKKTEKQLKIMAHYDALTGLPNRVLLADRLAQNIAQTKRNNKLLLVCFLDLDGFKVINDKYGHDIGDKLLVEVAGVLSSEIRTGDTIARIGGDEFVILLSDINNLDEVDTSLIRINQIITNPIVIDDVTHHVSASIGLTIYPSDNSDADTLLRHADLAMYEAKQAGRNRYHIFDASLDLEIHKQHQEIERIRTALVNNEFCLYYQPKVDLETNEVVGMEALIRWQHPERGLLGPFDFLPLIEGNELIVTMGDWVIEQALSQIKQWQVEGEVIAVSVNVAARQIQHPRFIEKLETMLALYPEVSSDLLEMEILETSALETLETGQIVMTTSKLLGVSFALDDFGTGYSSLSYLKRLPAKTLKIDQTFVRDMLVDMEDQAIVAGVVKLAKVFGRNVIAEGVETKEHGDKLLELGCRLVQGYGIARPMPADEVLTWVRNYKKQ